MESIFNKTCYTFHRKQNRDIYAHTEQLRIHTTYQDYTKYTLKSRLH